MHTSVSIRKQQVQVNLNLTADGDRALVSELKKAEAELSRLLGSTLTFEDKPVSTKSAVRASLGYGYDDTQTWDAQHYWAIGMMLLFQSVFRARVNSDRQHPAIGIL